VFVPAILCRVPILDYAKPQPRLPYGVIVAVLVLLIPAAVAVWHYRDNQRRALAVLATGVPRPAVTGVVGSPPMPTAIPLAVQAIDLRAGEVVNGSGFLVAPGLLVTAAHVVVGKTPLSAVAAREGILLTLGKVLDDDPASDLAIVAVLADASEPQPVPLKISSLPASPGQRVTVLSRFGITPATVIGPVDDPVVGAALLLDAPRLGVGASGAAVVNHAGEVVAIVRGAVDDDPTQVVAVPVARLRALLDRISDSP
jgi:stage V sporulation protein SpoVS